MSEFYPKPVADAAVAANKIQGVASPALPSYPFIPYAPEVVKVPDLKDTNPKDLVGVKKVPFSTVPMGVVAEVGLALLEGDRKYGRHNYRDKGVLASVYFDALMRHMADWWEGTDIDPDSGLSHVTKAIASLVVLRDSMIRGNWIDDRPPSMQSGWVSEMNKKAEGIIEKYPDRKPPHTEKKI